MATAFPKLHQALQLSIPNVGDSQVVWNRFSKKLRIMLQEHQYLGYERLLTKEQDTLLTVYFEWNLLLLDCLKLANLSEPEKQKIKNSLLLPPAEVET